MIRISGKSLSCFKKGSTVKKLSISDCESFLESIFDLTEYAKYCLQETAKIWTFNVTDLLYIFLKDWKNALIIQKMSKN